jgi:hypothetical protein
MSFVVIQKYVHHYHISVEYLLTLWMLSGPRHSMSKTVTTKNTMVMATQISCLLWDTKVHYCINKSPPLVLVFSHVNLLHTLTQYLWFILVCAKNHQHNVSCSESSGMHCRVLNWMSTDISEVRDASIIRVIGRHSIKNMAVHPRRFWASYSPPWELEISHNVSFLKCYCKFRKKVWDLRFL